jgi:hypothetical protein
VNKSSYGVRVSQGVSYDEAGEGLSNKKISYT